MATEISEGTIIVGEYKVTECIRKCAAFQWVRAVEMSAADRPVTLQVLLCVGVPEAPDAIARYVDDLQRVTRRGLTLPRTVSDAEYPLVLVYDHLSGEPLGKALSIAVEPAQAHEWWFQAGEALHALHNKSIAHGYITIDSFIVSEGTVYLTNFGYAPLLEIGCEEVISECDGCLAPEVRAEHKVDNLSDIFAFATAVAHWRPEITATSWYQQATDADRSKRFQRVRPTCEQLVETLKKLPPPHVSPERSGPVPKHALSIDVQPAAGGTARGAGTYVAHGGVAPQVPIEARPSAGWEFERWSGDLQSSANPTTICLDSSKTVTAHFKTESASVILTVRAEPAEGGSVTGGGTYSRGTSAPVAATAKRDWVFREWNGDLSGRAARDVVELDSDKTVVARFVPLPKPPLPAWWRRRTTWAGALCSVLALTMWAGWLAAGIIEKHRPHPGPSPAAPTAPPAGVPRPAKTPSPGSQAKRLMDEVWEQDEKLETQIDNAGSSDATLSNAANQLEKLKPKCVQALSLAEEAIRLQPNDLTGWYQKARALFYLRQYEKALATVRQAEERFPDEKSLPALQAHIEKYRRTKT